MTIPNLDVDDTISDSWVDAVADKLNDLPDVLTTTVIDGKTTNSSGVLNLTAAELGLTTITGLVVTGNYGATSSAQMFQGARLVSAGASVDLRFINGDDGTAWTSSGGIDPLFVIAWGTP